MNKLLLGFLCGAVLGALDACLVFLFPVPRDMIGMIFASSALKSGVAGVLTGLVARKVASLGWCVAVGGFINVVLSIFPAMQSGHPAAVLVPGALIGMVCGLMVNKFGK